VFCDLHKLLLYIRKSQKFTTDLVIRSKANGISVKFFVSLRRGMIKALQKLALHFDLIIYTSVEKAIGNVIIDFIEENYCQG
jgi:hypothetical protein